ncbi:Isoflavone reductase family protein [Neofusicoccum parvum]|uniref:Isoflavone reductase family protein n=1 Tax=Neofusicoccum parvum TaxID=310453 RepID=A0ACB5RZM2_9PEZI|nr:Isoflavone reductase family protein [Neofusicoccum parvum]
MELKNIAVVGAGGNVGTSIIRQLLDDGSFVVTAITRGSFTAPDPRIRTVVADYEDQASLEQALAGQDAVLCCIPGGQVQFDSQKRLIDAAIAAGVKLFFADEFVADISTPQYAIFPPQFVGDKVRVRAYLEEQAAAGKICWTALNGGPFFDMWLLGGPAGFDIAARKATIYGTGNNLSCWTPLPFMATAARNMLRNPDAIKNRPIFVAGVRDNTQGAILEALEAELGEPFAVERVDIKNIKVEALELLQKGEFKQANRGLALSGQFNEEGSAANFWPKVENELVGVEPVSVRDAVKMTLAAAEKK